MKNLMKSVQIIRQVFGLFMGNNFTTPATETLERYPLVTPSITNTY
jgi:hypothetical protein